MYLICYQQVSGRYFQPEPAMYSRCFHWFPGPLAPSEYFGKTGEWFAGDHTGGKGSITQWVYAEYMVGSETICPTFTQWVGGGYFSKVPTKVPINLTTMYPAIYLMGSLRVCGKIEPNSGFSLITLK